MCLALKEIYKGIFDEDFDYASLDSRIKLQKAVYLLEVMGIYVGDYSFSWAKYGPYSLHLDSDAQFCMTQKEQDYAFSDSASEAFAKIRKMLAVPHHPYNTRYWIECLASIHYLQNVFHYTKKHVLDVLPTVKNYLCDEELNSNAAKLIARMIGND